MISLHTIENVYDDDHSYHQFIQRGRQHLLDSEALGSPGTLRSFLQGEVIDNVDIPDERLDRTLNLLQCTLESGDIAKLLSYAERVFMRGSGAEHVCMTRFGEWTFDTVVIEPPSLRELQEDVWAEVDDYPKSDWQHEVSSGDVTSGYWEWVENKREGQSIMLVAKSGYLCVDWDDVHDQTHLDGDDSCLMLHYPAGDVDMVRWPYPNIKLLRGALQDARETGLIADVPSVLLPSGEEFFIDQPYWNVGDHVTWTDPDDGVCSRTGVLSAVSELGDFNIAITMEDGWMAEVCESELKRAL